eukprot:6783825-Pyramimonas_sp.AAC.1
MSNKSDDQTGGPSSRHGTSEQIDLGEHDQKLRISQDFSSSKMEPKIGNQSWHVRVPGREIECTPEA